MRIPQQNSRVKACTSIRVGGHTVGTVVGSAFEKTIHTQHFLRKPPSIAFDVDTLDAAEKAGATFVRITHSETRDRYEADIALIRSKGIRMNRGWGDQLALPLPYWRKNGVGPDAATPQTSPPVPPPAQGARQKQMSLFAEVA